MGQSVIEHIQHGQIASSYLILGTEVYIGEQVVQALRDKMVTTDSLNEWRYDLEEISIQEVIDEAESVSFFAEQKLMLLEQPYFLTGDKKTHKVTHDIERLMDYLEHPAENVVFVWLAHYEKLDERKKLTKLLKKQSVLVEAQKMNNGDTKRWILQYVEQENIAIQAEALEELLYLTQGDLETTVNELKKLTLYAEGDVITSAIVTQLVPKTLEHRIFDITDYLLRQQKQAALNIYQELIQSGEDTIKINYILVMQLRLFMQVRILMERRYSQKQMADALKVHPYRVKKAMQQLSGYTLAQLGQMYDQCVEVEYALKSSVMDQTLLFELLILNI